MSWYAKPSGTYYFSSEEGRANVTEINGFLNGRYYTLEAQAGIIGNIMAESGLNPWLWENNSVVYTRGYGLFQFTPASGYLEQCRNNYGYAPNLSVTEQTSGAHPYDGYSQLTAFADDQLNKWVGSCWRSYWNPSDYPDLYQMRTEILNQFGDGSYLSMNQFRQITYIEYATLAFLACYEGPTIPNYQSRYDNALIAYNMIGGDVPPTPPRIGSHIPIWMMLRRL